MFLEGGLNKEPAGLDWCLAPVNHTNLLQTCDGWTWAIKRQRDAECKQQDSVWALLQVCLSHANGGKQNERQKAES